MQTAPSFASNWADDVEAEEAERGKAPIPVDAALPSYAFSPPDGGGSGAGEHASHPRPLATPPALLPDRPPFTAYLDNVPYEVDELAVEHFFRGLAIADMSIARFSDTGRARGCFVEFATQQDLSNALTYDGANLMRRPVRIKVAENRQRSRGGGGPPPRGRPSEDDFGRSFGSGGRRRAGVGFTGSRFDDSRPGGPPFPHGDGGRQDRFDDSRGPASSSERWTAVRDVPRIVDQRTPTSPRERPKLSLQPRSEGAGGVGGGVGAQQGGSAKSNPFGDAKPADTAAKLRELEERERTRKAEVSAEKKKDAVQGSVSADAKEMGTAKPAATGVDGKRSAPAQTQKQQPSEGLETATEPRPPPPKLLQRPKDVLGDASNPAPVPASDVRGTSTGRGNRGAAAPRPERTGGRGEGRGRGRGRGGGGGVADTGAGAAGSGRGASSSSHSREHRRSNGREGNEEDLPHHRQGGGAGRRGGGRGGARGGNKASGAGTASSARVVLAATEDEGPKTRISNVFDVLGEGDD